jgi:hypothetical protein
MQSKTGLDFEDAFMYTIDMLEERGYPYQDALYSEETVSVSEKRRLMQRMRRHKIDYGWEKKRDEALRKILTAATDGVAPGGEPASASAGKPENDSEVDFHRPGIMKSVVFRYMKNGSEPHFIIACTSGRERVSPHELMAEFGLSKGESDTLDHRMSSYHMFEATGRWKGEIGPIVADEKLERLDGIYFTNSLMRRSLKEPKKAFDIPYRMDRSMMVRATHLFEVLKQRSSKYRTWSAFEGDVPFEVLEWKVREGERKNGVDYLFAGTTVSYRGREYVIRNPRKGHPGYDRRAHCYGMPVSDGARLLGHVPLPISYQDLESRFDKYLNQFPNSIQ